MRDITGGDDGLIGIPRPDITIGDWTLGSTGEPFGIYYFTLLVVLIVCFPDHPANHPIPFRCCP